MITVHHLNNSRSQRVLWLLEELAIPYEVKRYERDAKTMLAPPALKAVHALGKSPVISDGDVTIAESGAIIEYLVTTYGDGRLVPKEGSPEKRQYTYWLHYAEGSVMPYLVMKLVMGRVATQPMPFFAKPIARRIAAGVQEHFIDPNLRAHFEFIESALGEREWFAGDDFTAADIQMSYPAEAASVRGIDTSKLPRMTAFLKRIHARPAYVRALERGGPYALMK